MNVLPNSAKISDRNGRDVFELDFASDLCKTRRKALPWRVCQCLGAANTLIHKESSETGALWHSSNHISWSQ